MKTFKQFTTEGKIDLDGAEIIIGATKNSSEAEKEIAKAFKVSPAEAKKVVKQIMDRAKKR